jgi:hypothetical protein
VEEDQGIYRGEVRAIMLGLTGIGANVERLLGYFEGGDDEEEEEDVSDA